MSYFPKLDQRYSNFKNWMDLRKEQGADVSVFEREIGHLMNEAAELLQDMKPPFTDKYYEPIPLDEIKAARPKGPRALKYDLTDDQLYDKMLGAWLGRGCLLYTSPSPRDRS